MQIFLNTTSSAPLGHLNRDAIQASIADTLSKIEHNVMSVSVFIADGNGPKGGDDITCRMVAEVPDGPALVTEVTAGEAAIAADGAAEELVARIRRYWDRRHKKGLHQALDAEALVPPVETMDASEVLARAGMPL